jgi:hypothetical protein
MISEKTRLTSQDPIFFTIETGITWLINLGVPSDSILNIFIKILHPAEVFVNNPDYN